MIILFLQVLLQFMKVFLEVFNLWNKWNIDEQQTKSRKINQYLENILTAITINKEAFDESAYAASINQEKKIRYELYREKITVFLLQGKGYETLETITFAGLNIRLAKIKEKAIIILASEHSAINRAKLLARELCEVTI